MIGAIFWLSLRPIAVYIERRQLAVIRSPVFAASEPTLMFDPELN